jgi:hypothetical protein
MFWYVGEGNLNGLLECVGERCYSVMINGCVIAIVKRLNKYWKGMMKNYSRSNLGSLLSLSHGVICIIFGKIH